MKRNVILAMLMVCVLLIAGCSKKESLASSSKVTAPVQENSMLGSTDAKVHLKVGTTTAPDGHYVAGLKFMQEKLEEYSNGEMTLDIYPNSQLGNERDMMENVGLGVQEMCLVSTGPIPNFVPDFAVFDLPYVFPNESVAYKVLDGEIGQSLLDQLDSHGIYAVGFWENGYRQLTNNTKEVLSPADLKGMKIRTMENNVHMETYNRFGASATPMAWGEIFSALQQGTVDGQENPIAIIESAKVYEVQKYISLINLFYSPCVLMISESVYSDFTPEQKAAFDKAAEDAKAYQRQFSQDYTAGAIERMEAEGVTIKAVDIPEWQNAVPVVDIAEKLNLNVALVEDILAAGK